MFGVYQKGKMNEMNFIASVITPEFVVDSRKLAREVEKSKVIIVLMLGQKISIRY